MNMSFDKMFDHLLTSILVINTQFEVQYANQATLSFLKTGRKQIYGRVLADFFLFSSLDNTRFHWAMTQHENFSENEVEVSLLDETVLVVDIAVSYINHDNHDALLIEAKHIDQQRRISKENQQMAQQHAAKELVRGLAHEIKNPLASLRSAVGTMRIAKREDQREKMLDLIEHDIQRMDRLVTDIASASRLDSELVREEEESFNLIEMLTNLSEFLGKEAEIKVRASCGIEEIMVREEPSSNT